MLRYIINRVLWMIPTIFAISIITFTLMHIAPGGPFDKDPSQGRPLSDQARTNLNRKFSLDQPWYVQYTTYMWNALHGDLGPSLQYKGTRDVSEILMQGFPVSARIGLQGIALALIIGIPLGVIAALKQNTWIDYVALFFATIGTSTPSFVLAIFLIVIFGPTLHWIDVIPKNLNNPLNLTPWILPSVTLGLGAMAFYARLTRSSVLESLRQDYVRTARAKGLKEQVVIMRHVIRNSMIPVATILGPAIAGVITGTFFIEQIFQMPGMGQLFVTSIQARDYPAIMGTTLFYALLIALANLTVDLVYGFLDPRIKVG